MAIVVNGFLMKRITTFSFTLLGLTAPLSLQAHEVLQSNQAFSGLVFTPNSQVLDSGDFSFTYSQGVARNASIDDLDSLSFSIGLFKGLEANGRIVTKTYDKNLFTESNGGIRDLSASFKYQIPAFWSDWGDLDGLNLAIGMQDVEGAANNFDAKYAVADYSFEFLPIRTSLGYGSSEAEGGILDGPFGGIEIQPLSFLQLVGEYDSLEYNAMAKVFTPEGTLPWNMQASLGFMFYSSHEDKDDTQVWQTQLSIPLAGDYVKRETSLNNQLTLQDKLTIAQANAENASLESLKQALEKEGFLNIRLGTQQQQLIVTVENRRYNHNQVDGAGIALGIISSLYSETTATELELESDAFTVVMLHNKLPVLKVQTSAESYRTFVREGGELQNTTFATSDLESVLDDTQWASDNIQSSFGRTQVILSPGLRYGVATEYGVFDYSMALEANTYTSLWKGAALDIRYRTPVSNSDDYEENGYWENSAFESEIDRILIHQGLDLPFDIHYQFSYGLIITDYLGFKNEATWVSPTGRHQLGAEYGSYSHIDDEDNGKDHGVKLASYTYSKPEWDWQLNIKGGEFWNNDKGYQVTTNHWFGDINVYASYLDSKFDDSKSEKYLTLGIAFPLTLWRDMSPDYVQFRGIDQFNLAIQTRIDDSHNKLNQGMGGTIPFQHNVEREYLNRGRYGSAYFDNQTVRLRNAYLRWLETQN